VWPNVVAFQIARPGCRLHARSEQVVVGTGAGLGQTSLDPEYAGLVLGVGGAFIAARVIRGLLFGVAPHDPLTLAGVALLMAAIGLGACWLPALRAARIDPGVALRAN
jgi:hypothetical protein